MQIKWLVNINFAHYKQYILQSKALARIESAFASSSDI